MDIAEPNSGKTRACDYCGKDYQFKRKTSRFCTENCKLNFHNANNRSKQLGDTGNPLPVVVVPRDGSGVMKKTDSILTKLEPHMQIAIDLLKADAANWKDLYKEACKDKKQLETTISELKEQLQQKQTALSGLESAQPNAFERFIGAIPKEILVEIGPALGNGLERLMSLGRSSSKSPVGAVNNNLDDEGQGQLNEINAWFCQLPKNIQISFYNVLVQCAQAGKDEATLIEILNRISNLFNNGTTFQSNQPAISYGQIATPTGT